MRCELNRLDRSLAVSIKESRGDKWCLSFFILHTGTCQPRLTLLHFIDTKLFAANMSWKTKCDMFVTLGNSSFLVDLKLLLLMVNVP